MCTGVGGTNMPRGKRSQPGLRPQSRGPRENRETTLWAVGRGPFKLEAGLILVGGVCVSRGRGSKGLEWVDRLPHLPVGCGRGLRVSVGGLRASSSR